MADDPKQIRTEFREAVNMTPSALRKWLDSDESKSVGQTRGGNSESQGHKFGRRILDLKGVKVADLTDKDLADMKKVTGYVARHTKQRPSQSAKELETSKWRYSLMNWGHDPLK